MHPAFISIADTQRSGLMSPPNRAASARTLVMKRRMRWWSRWRRAVASQRIMNYWINPCIFLGILGYNMIIHDITINTPAVTNLLPPLACGWGFFVERGMDCPRLGGAVPPCFTQPRNKTITTTARPRHSGGLNQAVLMGRMELNT